MATLTSAATATDAFLTVSNPAQNLAQGTLFRIDDEVLAFDRYGGDNRPGHRDYNTWFVYRGQNHSVAAAHAQGATVQAAVDAFLAGTFGDPPGPFDAGAGGDFDIPGLPALATPDDADVLPIVDVSAAVTKKVTVANLLASGAIQVATVTLTDAEIKGAPTANGGDGPELFAAPGEGLAWLPIGGYAVSNIVAPYTNMDNLAEIVVGWDFGNHDATTTIHDPEVASPSALLQASRFIQLSPSMFDVFLTGGSRHATFDPADITNKNLSLYVDNGSDGDLTGGDPANTLTIVLLYHEIEL